MLSAIFLVVLKFNANTGVFELLAWRNYAGCTGEYIRIEKNTNFYALRRGVIPLVAYYSVTDYYPPLIPAPPPGPPGSSAGAYIRITLESQ
jgi:hypothetical protein